MEKYQPLRLIFDATHLMKPIGTQRMILKKRVQKLTCIGADRYEIESEADFVVHLRSVSVPKHHADQLPIRVFLCETVADQHVFVLSTFASL